MLGRTRAVLTLRFALFFAPTPAVLVLPLTPRFAVDPLRARDVAVLRAERFAVDFRLAFVVRLADAFRVVEAAFLDLAVLRFRVTGFDFAPRADFLPRAVDLAAFFTFLAPRAEGLVAFVERDGAAGLRAVVPRDADRGDVAFTSAACAAASRAIGTRSGLHET